ncbi:hypothetical protein [Dyadobacter sediminis]|uniref:Uncharacterized protein n=1 Tax=Dyadobacter sediminis TaxID=1493691 RepID=A0A5R9KBB1_9BACT|nr:hypothetical protein [Dyadobacter sediminis]TLU92052.1 hypothetical protein FEM55_14975 [Dyadobacter sediminis]GGB97816.1 hypothetical protein GCM10011325_26430 [Dyadobacter sediminis]
MEHIDISLGELSKPGTYSFDNEDSLALGAYSIRVQDENIPLTVIKRCYYDEIRDKRKGTLTITKLDMDKGILAGTFEFTLIKSTVSEDCDPILKITEGRFDMKF